MKKTTGIVIVLLFIASVFMWAGGRTETPVSQQRPDRLNIGFSPPASETNRIWTTGWVNYTQYEPILETLIGNDPETGLPIPRLAERWEASPDFRKWTFHLRRGVPFHHGYGEMTAADVKHTYGLISRDDSAVNLAHVWRERIIEVEVIDDYTIAFHFADPYIDGERLFSRTGGELYITSKAQWDEEGVQGMDRRLIGTGAYRYKERVEGQHLIVEAVSDHWRDEPDFKEIALRWIPEATTRLALLVSGELDAAELSMDIAQAALGVGMELLQSQQVNMQQFIGFGGMYFNSSSPNPDSQNPLNDRRVRQALAKAIDVHEIYETIYHGAIAHYVRPGWVSAHEGWNPEWEQRYDDMYGYDPVRARQLLREAGYGDGDLQVRINRITPAPGGQAEWPDVLDSLPSYWERIGVTATVIPVEHGAYLTRWFGAELHGEIISSRNTPLRTTQEFIGFWHTANSNGRYYLDDFIEKSSRELAQTFDLEERDRIAREVGDFLFEEFAMIPVGAKRDTIVVNPNVISSWVWPGMAPTGKTHYYLIEAAR